MKLDVVCFTADTNWHVNPLKLSSVLRHCTAVDVEAVFMFADECEDRLHCLSLIRHQSVDNGRRRPVADMHS